MLILTPSERNDNILQHIYRNYYEIYKKAADAIDAENSKKLVAEIQKRPTIAEALSWLMRDGRKVTAIKLARDVFSWGLKDAKDACEALHYFNESTRWNVR